MRVLVMFLMLTFSGILFSQKTLILDDGWNKRIEQNRFLAPAFYGVSKTKKERKRETKFVENAIQTYQTRSKAFEHYYIQGWNYFNVGIVDTAIIHFNKSFLLDSSDIRLAYAFGNVLLYLNGRPDDTNLNKETFPNYILWDIFHLEDRPDSRPYEGMIAFGDGILVDQLKSYHAQNLKYTSLPALNSELAHPYSIDSAKYILVTVTIDDAVGTYKNGVADGHWKQYYIGTDLLMREYQIVNGREHGKITAYHKNGNLASEFYKVNGTITGEFKIYDYDGKLVRVEHWYENTMDSKNTYLIREWEEDGTEVYNFVNGNLVVTHVWKNGVKVAVE